MENEKKKDEKLTKNESGGDRFIVCVNMKN